MDFEKLLAEAFRTESALHGMREAYHSLYLTLSDISENSQAARTAYAVHRKLERICKKAQGRHVRRVLKSNAAHRAAR
jgi:hypothetical protein